MKMECPKPGQIKNIPAPTCGGINPKRMSLIEGLERNRQAVKERLLNASGAMVKDRTSPGGSPVSVQAWQKEINRLQTELNRIDAEIKRVSMQ